MDLDRFKKKQSKVVPNKRSINSGERINGVRQPIGPKPVNNSANELLFDDNDKDIFGIWQKQDAIKQQRKAEEAAAKAAKKATKDARKLEKQRAKAHRKATGAPNKVAVSITVPTVKPSIRKLPGYADNKKAYLWSAVLVCLPLIAISLGLVLNRNARPTTKGEVNGAQTTTTTKPDFSTIKPTTVDNQATDIKYDGTKKVASYNDVLDDVPITVSQQPLPSGFQSDPTGKVADLAKQINANDKISTSDTTAYAGLSIKGPQTVVFTKNDLLIFIYADKKIDVLTWTKYIESMRTK